MSDSPILIRLHDWLFSDGRISSCAMRAETSRREVIGALAMIWHASQRQKLSEAQGVDILGWCEYSGPAGVAFLHALVSSRLVTLVDDAGGDELAATYRIGGNRDEIAFREKQQKNGAQGGRPKTNPNETQTKPKTNPNETQTAAKLGSGWVNPNESQTKTKEKGKEKEKEKEKKKIPLQTAAASKKAARAIIATPPDAPSAGGGGWESVDVSPLQKLGIKITAAHVRRVSAAGKMDAASFQASVKYLAFDLAQHGAIERIKDPLRVLVALSLRGESYDRPFGFRDVWADDNRPQDATA